MSLLGGFMGVAFGPYIPQKKEASELLHWLKLHLDFCFILYCSFSWVWFAVSFYTIQKTLRDRNVKVKDEGIWKSVSIYASTKMKKKVFDITMSVCVVIYSVISYVACNALFPFLLFFFMFYLHTHKKS